MTRGGIIIPFWIFLMLSIWIASNLSGQNYIGVKAKAFEERLLITDTLNNVEIVKGPRQSVIFTERGVFFTSEGYFEIKIDPKWKKEDYLRTESLISYRIVGVNSPVIRIRRNDQGNYIFMYTEFPELPTDSIFLKEGTICLKCYTPEKCFTFVNAANQGAIFFNQNTAITEYFRKCNDIYLQSIIVNVFGKNLRFNEPIDYIFLDTLFVH